MITIDTRRFSGNGFNDRFVVFDSYSNQEIMEVKDYKNWVWSYSARSVSANK